MSKSVNEVLFEAVKNKLQTARESYSKYRSTMEDLNTLLKAMSILDKKYAEAKKLPFVRNPLAWALYHTWREFDDGKRCD